MGDSDDEEVVEQLLKIAVLGDGACGKTSICSRFAQDVFGKSYRQTVGLDFFTKRLELPGNLSVTVQIWDIGGQSIGGPMLDKYLYGSHGIFLVYDITNRSTFDNLIDWMNMAQKYTVDREKKPEIFLVANKADVEHMRAIDLKDHKHFAEQHEIRSFFVSAKTGDSVNLIFQMIACNILGIQLSKREEEQQMSVVKAEIPAPLIPIISPSNRIQKKNQKSTVCTIQ